jgi:hypothetical protein
MKARIKLLSGYEDEANKKTLADFETEGKPPYGSERDPKRVNFCVMPFEAPASDFDYHNSKKFQTMVVYGYDPVTRQTQSVSIPPRGRIEIEAA